MILTLGRARDAMLLLKKPILEEELGGNGAALDSGREDGPISGYDNASVMRNSLRRRFRIRDAGFLTGMWSGMINRAHLLLRLHVHLFPSQGP
jgi:hypothetical protein